MLGKIAKVSKKIRDKKWDLYEKRIKLARKIRASNFRFTQKIRKAWRKLKRSIKDFCIFVLVKRIFIGFGYGIYAGIKDAINSWKFDRDKIEDYDIEINGLSFHER